MIRITLIIIAWSLLLLIYLGNANVRASVIAQIITGEAHDFDIADILQNIPPSSRKELLKNTNQSILIAHLETFQQLINFTETSATTTAAEASDDQPSMFSKAITYPNEDIAIFYNMTPAFISSNNQTLALLMLKFTNNTSDEDVMQDSLDYSVEINGTNSIFDENGTTSTGSDIKILNSTALAESTEHSKNYNMIISITRLNENVVSEQTRQLNVTLPTQPASTN
jgi:hypothetical protein